MVSFTYTQAQAAKAVFAEVAPQLTRYLSIKEQDAGNSRSYSFRFWMPPFTYDSSNYYFRAPFRLFQNITEEMTRAGALSAKGDAVTTGIPETSLGFEYDDGVSFGHAVVLDFATTDMEKIRAAAVQAEASFSRFMQEAKEVQSLLGQIGLSASEMRTVDHRRIPIPGTLEVMIWDRGEAGDESYRILRELQAKGALEPSYESRSPERYYTGILDAAMAKEMLGPLPATGMVARIEARRAEGAMHQNENKR